MFSIINGLPKNGFKDHGWLYLAIFDPWLSNRKPIRVHESERRPVQLTIVNDSVHGHIDSFFLPYLPPDLQRALGGGIELDRATQPVQANVPLAATGSHLN